VPQSLDDLARLFRQFADEAPTPESRKAYLHSATELAAFAARQERGIRLRVVDADQPAA
jgi:hypothetical protein